MSIRLGLIILLLFAGVITATVFFWKWKGFTSRGTLMPSLPPEPFTSPRAVKEMIAWSVATVAIIVALWWLS